MKLACAFQLHGSFREKSGNVSEQKAQVSVPRQMN